MNKKILDSISKQIKIKKTKRKLNKEYKVKPNLFLGRTDAQNGNAKFPDWDIIPPNQFINPRIKHK